MAFCNKCGTEIPEDAMLCHACGTVSEKPDKPKNDSISETESLPLRDVTEKEKNSVYAKGIIAAVLALYPITSIAAIILGAITRKQYMAVYESGIPVGGKLKTGGILSKVGVSVGIVMSIFWAFDFLILKFFIKLL